MPSGTALPDKSIAIVLGTRPEIIKLGHIVRLLGSAGSIIHTGQHFDSGLSKVFFEAFQLPEPDAVLGVGGASRGAQLGLVITHLDRIFQEWRPAAVVVQGDTNSAAAGAIAANACGVPLVHVESGLRSFDRRMPEEHNRIIADHLADLCCAPTETNRSNLHNEGVPDDRIVVTGNTVVEAVRSLLPGPAQRAAVLDSFGMPSGGFALATFHRPENVDHPATLDTIMEQLDRLPIPVLLPLHPRTAARLGSTVDSIRTGSNVKIVEPLGYEEFIGLAAESAMLITDSGGLQEEASVVKVPVLVVRRSTERPEVLGTFAERVEPGPGIAEVAARWLGRLSELHSELAALPSPYGDGTASEKTVTAITRMVLGTR